MEEDTASGDIAVTLEPFAEPTEPVLATGATVAVAESMAANALLIGDPEAPLSITVYLHPSSPYAREFQRSRMPALLSRFVERGRLAILLVTLPIQKYPGTEDAVRATMCGIDQGKGYAVHDRLHANGTTVLDGDDLEELGLDPALYAACVGTMSGDLLSATRLRAQQEGVTLVPTYVIRGEAHVGLPTEADLLGAINAAL